MIVYGDRTRQADPVEQAERVRAVVAHAQARSPGLSRHAALVGAFIQAGELLQGVADAELAVSGCDDRTPAQDAGMSLLLELAGSAARSWTSGFQATHAPSLEALPTVCRGAPSSITCKTAEGHAYYAVYPEAYFEAAANTAWPEPPIVIGVRSIGAGLAAMAAAGSGAGAPITVRPVGPPFSRRLALSASLSAELRADRFYAVTDEGPGLSGSSFGAVGDALEDAGVAPDRVTYMPSHGGAPGPMSSPRHRARWAASRRTFKDFDGLSLTAPRPEHRLASWVEDLTGPLVTPLKDLSAGAWRKERGLAAPAIPALERRKFLAQAENRSWLLKFAGLGAQGEDRLRRAAALAAHGYAPSVAGLRHGFTVERWMADARAPDFGHMNRENLVERLARYIAFRAEAFPARQEDGASLAQLADMARFNLAEALGPDRARYIAGRLAWSAQRARPGPPVHVDGRMHAWEWLALPDNRLLKADAVDHSSQHDLIGCQDPCWDVVGAQVELGLSDAEAADLARRIGRRLNRALDPALLDVFSICYPAFQLGLWSLAGSEGDQVSRYLTALTETAHA